MPSHHDKLVKAVFGTPKEAARHFARFMPADVAAQLDLGTLGLVDACYIDETLGERHSDLLFEVRSRAGDDALVYLVFEHQSTADPMMPWRLLRYVVRVWDDWTKRNPGKTSLPPVFPYLLSQVDGGWRAPRALDDIISGDAGLKAALAPYMPSFEMFVDDLMTRPIEDLRGPHVAALARLVLRFARTDGVALMSAAWVQEWRAVKDASGTGVWSWARLFVEYLLVVDDGATPEALAASEDAIDHDLGEVPMKYVHQEEIDRDYVHKDDVEQRYKQGMRQGEERGILRGQAKTVHAQLTLRFGHLDAATATRLDGATAEQLETYSLRVITATSLDDVFAD